MQRHRANGSDGPNADSVEPGYIALEPLPFEGTEMCQLIEVRHGPGEAD